MRTLLLILIILPTLVLAQGIFSRVISQGSQEPQPQLVEPPEAKDLLSPLSQGPLARPKVKDKLAKKPAPSENFNKWLKLIDEYKKIIDELRNGIKKIPGYRGDFEELDQLSLHLSDQPAYERRQEGGAIVRRRVDIYDLQEQLGAAIKTGKLSEKDLVNIIEKYLIPYIEITQEDIRKKLKGKGRVTFGMPDTEHMSIGKLYNEIANWEDKNPALILGYLDFVLAKLKKDLEKLRKTKGQQPPQPVERKRRSRR